MTTNKKIYAFDLDGTLCTLTENTGGYLQAKPFLDIIKRVNELYYEGHTIKIFTARGCVSGKDWTEETKNQLRQWGVLYHELIMGKKPHFDILVDDKVINIKDWRREQKLVKGFVASTFDLIHPGYVLMLEEAKTVCDYLVCAIQIDPTFNRKEKNKPVQTFHERKTILSAIKYVDEIVEYTSENELETLLKTIQPDIRILGTDYKGKRYTGEELHIPIHWHKRDHLWSTSSLRNRIWLAEHFKDNK
jgi:glycerol-3-phosphate cytidylyltransferase